MSPRRSIHSHLLLMPSCTYYVIPFNCTDDEAENKRHISFDSSVHVGRPVGLVASAGRLPPPAAGCRRRRRRWRWRWRRQQKFFQWRHCRLRAWSHNTRAASVPALVGVGVDGGDASTAAASRRHVAESRAHKETVLTYYELCQ